MRKAILLAAVIVVAGCATAPAPTPGRAKSGSINAKYSETVSLTAGPVYSLARYIGSTDTVGIDLRRRGERLLHGRRRGEQPIRSGHELADR